ncbi:MAG: ABC transporter substrate-binding protein [Lachnospiraceae bacterium]|nr:ABC transporter substrate-binding protein [Lachnospiraceae bacterium]
MKKITALVLTLVMALSMTACGTSNSGTEDGTTAAAEGSTDGKTYKIGAIQYTEHPALDLAYDGFVKALADKGLVEGENLEIDFQNAQADVSNCETIATKFVNDGNDLLFAIATPAAQALAGKTTDIPILCTAVTDPQSAGLVNDNENPGTNVSGTSDLTPVAEQINLLKQILPDAKKIAIMYCSSEDNSIFQADMAKEACKDVGLEYEDATVSESNQIQQVTESLIGKVDAIYIPTDNLLAEGMATVAQVANANNLPCVVGEEGMCENGGIGTYSISYEALGYMAGEQAASILLDGADVSTMPIGYCSVDDCEMIVNTTAAKDLGIEIPQDVLDQATTVE